LKKITTIFWKISPTLVKQPHPVRIQPKLLRKEGRFREITATLEGNYKFPKIATTLGEKIS